MPKFNEQNDYYKMSTTKIYTFSAVLEIIGMNPFVFLPDKILKSIFGQAKTDKGAIPVIVTIGEKSFKQSLVKYRDEWRLYINSGMLKNSPRRIGEMLKLSIAFDPIERLIKPHPGFVQALNDNREAKKAFDNLPPSVQKEMIRYISFLKRENSIAENIIKAIGFLEGRNKFIGREPFINN